MHAECRIQYLMMTAFTHSKLRLGLGATWFKGKVRSTGHVGFPILLVVAYMMFQ